jgi:hypothetical protein
LPRDLPLIEGAAADVQAKLIVFDPFTAFLEGNANVDQNVRRVLTPLAAFAERTNVAIVLVRHLIKGGASNSLYRGAGSIAIIAHARSALRVTAEPGIDDPHQHILVQTKTNLSSAPSLSYRTVKKNDGIVIEWLGVSRVSSQEAATQRLTEQSALAEASLILYAILVDGPVAARQAIKVAGNEGVARRTLDRAKTVLGVRCRRRGSGEGCYWMWELPDDEERLRPFKERALDELMEQLLEPDDNPLPGDGWKKGRGKEDDEWRDGRNDGDDDDDGQIHS